jgi:superfamily II DNA or RNA helicase
MAIPLVTPDDNGFEDLLRRVDGGGRGFEQLVAWFLLHDPEWSARVRQVWLWDDWPGNFGPDRGIDLVAETHDSVLIAVQAKHYAITSTVSKADVDSFLSESNRPQFSERLLVATTQLLARGAREVIAAQEKPVSVVLRDRLADADMDWSTYGTGGSPLRQPRTPRPHQQRAVDQVIRGFDNAARGQLIMPCGTGKTLTSMWVARALDARTVLVLAPTIVLIRQLAKEWATELGDQFALLKVCSDSPRDDELARADLPAIEVGGQVTTDPEQIAGFLAREGRRLIVCTYDSSPRIADAIKLLGSQQKLDLIIYDEAHHCAGLHAGTHKTALDDERIPAHKRLFVTATPTVFGASAKAQAVHAHARIASMDDRQLFGRVLHRLTFKRAVEQKLLCPYQVVVIPVRSDEVSELVRRRALVTPDAGEHVTDAYTLAGQIACLRAMRTYNARRLVAFHASVPDSRHFTAEVSLAAGLLDDDERPATFHAEHVDGYMSAGKRQRALHRFLTDHDTPQLLSNVRLLAEGLDVPRIDAICLMNTQHNPAWIAQAVGRVVRTAEGKRVGTIVLPVLIRDGEAPRDALRSSEHRAVLDVLAAMRSIDADIVNEIDQLRLEHGPRWRGVDGPRGWHIDVPTEIGEEFAAAVQVELVDLIKARSSRGVAPRPRQRDEDEHPFVFASHMIPDGDLDFSDEQTIEVGLRIAEQWDDHNFSRVGSEPNFMGFPIARWWERIQQLWEDGLLPRDVKLRCAGLFNWLSMDGETHPTARAEMIELDLWPLHSRINEWLWPWGHHRRDHDLDELAKAGHIGWRAPVSTEEVVALVPSELAPPERAQLVIAALKIIGQAMREAAEEPAEARAGFREAVQEPGRPHGLQTQYNAAGRPVGKLACHAHGWDAAQQVLRLIDETPRKPKRQAKRVHNRDPDHPPARRRRRRDQK